MFDLKPLRIVLLTSGAGLALAACDGATDVGSPGAGTIIINPTPTPVASTPTPTVSPTPTPTAVAAITAAQFGATSGQPTAISITPEEQLALVTAGSNNNVNGTGGVTGITPTAGAAATTASDPTTLNNASNNNFFVKTNYVGAVAGASDTAFQGWTCNSSSVDFGTASQPCTAVPSIGTPAAASCPTGTIDDGTNSSSSPTFRYCRLPQVITTNMTLAKLAGVVYRFRGQTEVGVDVGTTGSATGGVSATLTIAAGVILAADSTEPSNDLLLVNRGSTINAVGSVSAPIIFTAQQNLSSNGVSDATQGLWGGVILLGRAPTGVCRTGTGPNNAAGSSTTCENPIEGVTGRFYGGPVTTDNSGTMQYVQIRYTGIAISEGNELQGLTLGATGNGTTLDHIQSHNSADDGIEIFGGTTNLRYLAMTGWDDDGFDIDNGYRGLAQFLIAAQKATGATADSFSTEIDSNGGEDLLPRTFARYANFTFIQNLAPAGSNPAAAMRIRGGADAAFYNGIIKTPAGVACLNVVATEVSQADRSTVRTADANRQDQGPPTFNSVYFACQGR